mgnify:CR=1 FL=1
MNSIDPEQISRMTIDFDLIAENRARYLMAQHWIRYTVGPYLIEAIYNNWQGYFFYSENNGLSFQPVYEVVIEPDCGRELEGVAGAFTYVTEWAEMGLSGKYSGKRWSR